MSSKTWFITGTRGFGREWPESALFGALWVTQAAYESRLATWNEWQSLSVAAHGSQD